jgi:hypothetical protein
LRPCAAKVDRLFDDFTPSPRRCRPPSTECRAADATFGEISTLRLSSIKDVSQQGLSIDTCSTFVIALSE